MHDGVVLVQYDDGTRKHAGKRSINDLHTVIFAEAGVANRGQAGYVDSFTLLLGSLVRKRQIVGDHEQRNIVELAAETVEFDHRPGTHRCVDTDKNIQYLGLAQTGR